MSKHVTPTNEVPPLWIGRHAEYMIPTVFKDCQKSVTVDSTRNTPSWHNCHSFYRPQRSWGKIIFSEACVQNPVHRKGACVAGQTPLQRTVRILLECILVNFASCGKTQVFTINSDIHPCLSSEPTSIYFYSIEMTFVSMNLGELLKSRHLRSGGSRISPQGVCQTLSNSGGSRILDPPQPIFSFSCIWGWHPLWEILDPLLYSSDVSEGCPLFGPFFSFSCSFLAQIKQYNRLVPLSGIVSSFGKSWILI